MENHRLKILVRTSLLLALALAVQSMRMPQMVTGPVINAVLILAVALGGGMVSGILVGSITPWVAVMTGIMVFAPVAPVIMAGNIALVVVFAVLSRSLGSSTGDFLAAVAAALAKFAVMFVGIRWLVAPSIALPPPAIVMLTTTQLYTAVIGGMLAVSIIKILGRLEQFKST